MSSFPSSSEPRADCIELTVACEWVVRSIHGCVPGGPRHVGVVQMHDLWKAIHPFVKLILPINWSLISSPFRTVILTDNCMPLSCFITLDLSLLLVDYGFIPGTWMMSNDCLVTCIQQILLEPILSEMKHQAHDMQRWISDVCCLPGTFWLVAEMRHISK